MSLFIFSVLVLYVTSVAAVNVVVFVVKSCC